MESSTLTRLPLEGYTVLDLSGTVATAVCGRMMADFGARVINIEPAQGHPTRSLPPQAGSAAEIEHSGLHLLLSPHKESVQLDLSKPEDRESILDWIAEADVVLEGETPGVLDAHGLGPEVMRERAPGLILNSISWYGQKGPRAQQPCFDGAVFAETGLAGALGPVEGPPLLPSGYAAQVLGGVNGFIACMQRMVGNLMAPEDAERASAHLDISIYESALLLTDLGPIAFFSLGGRSERLGLNRFAATAPVGVYPTKDGWIGPTPLLPSQWRALTELLGLPELFQDPRFVGSVERVAHADELDALIGPAFMTRTAQEWFIEGQAKRIPMALVPTMGELFESEQMRALDAFRSVEHPDLGSFEVPGPPYRLHATPAHKNGPVARLGASLATPSHKGSGRTPAAQSRAAPSSRTPLHEPESRPSLLRGLRVVDLTVGWAGPLAARFLADHGAEVIKVESCKHWDFWRGWELTPETAKNFDHEKNRAFNMVNRNKRDITLELDDPRGNELFRELIAVSDVLIENNAASVMPKLGLEYQRLAEINPRLVMLSMPPFGAGGPWHGYRAFGSTVEQASGLPHLNGNAQDPPTMIHIALGDPVAGCYAAAAMLTGILHQQRTGEGQFIDLSQVESTLALGVHGLAHQILHGEMPERIGSRDPVHAPQGVYRCAGDDQWLALSVQSDSQWGALVERIGDPELAGPELETAAARQAHHDRIDERINVWTASQPKEVLCERLQACGVPAAGILDAPEVMAHPQHEARDFWQWLEQPHVGLQPHPSSPARTVDGPAGIDTPTRTLGQDNEEVLKGLLGVSDAEFRRLEEDGVIGTMPAP